ncbi:hypothetical protein CSUI_011294, partial [Cystoisospora suis]
RHVEVRARRPREEGTGGSDSLVSLRLCVIGARCCAGSYVMPPAGCPEYAPRVQGAHPPRRPRVPSVSRFTLSSFPTGQPLRLVIWWSSSVSPLFIFHV